MKKITVYADFDFLVTLEIICYKVINSFLIA